MDWLNSARRLLPGMGWSHWAQVASHLWVSTPATQLFISQLAPWKFPSHFDWGVSLLQSEPWSWSDTIPQKKGKCWWSVVVVLHSLDVSTPSAVSDMLKPLTSTNIAENATTVVSELLGNEILHRPLSSSPNSSYCNNTVETKVVMLLIEWV